MSRAHSNDTVWSQTTKSGFRQQVMVMYHGTDAASAEAIIRGGFNLSDHTENMLGRGIYVSKYRYCPFKFS